MSDRGPERPRVVVYEARPTRMFGSYVIWANYADGSGKQIGQGDPMYCLREAARLNTALAPTAWAADQKTPEKQIVTPGIQLDFGPEGCTEHKFGLPDELWDRLNGRGFWVFGAGTGYGQAVAAALAAAGARVILTGRRENVLADTIASLHRNDIPESKCHIVPADINDPKSLADAVAQISQIPDMEINGAVACAAVPQSRVSPWPLTDMPMDYWEKMISTNVTGQLNAFRAVHPMMLAKRQMHMVFFTSEAGWADTEGVGPYNVTKAALNSFAMSLARECEAKYPNSVVQINVLDPGEARTEMNQGSSIRPYAAVPMTLALLAQPATGPNGRFFHRDGRHLDFAYAKPWPKALFDINPNTETGVSAGARTGQIIRRVVTKIFEHR